MLHFDTMEAALLPCKALSSKVRIEIMELLYEKGGKNLNEIAELLGLSNSAVGVHVGKLEEAGLIRIRNISGRRGSMKICEPTDTSLFIELRRTGETQECYTHHIEVGQYTLCHAEPTCGIATQEHVIGEYDDPRYFAFPERFQADLLWLTNGFVEYAVPNSLKAGERIRQLSFSMEISSEAPGIREEYPSDIYFYVNGVSVGYWISPGDFGSRRGRFNPPWWPEDKNQYGLLKELSIDGRGTFIDGGLKISDVTIDQLNITYNSILTFRIAAPLDTTNSGGLTLFGRGFGDFNQGIRVSMRYEERQAKA